VPGPVTGSLHGETVGIVGLGNIGSALAPGGPYNAA